MQRQSSVRKSARLERVLDGNQRLREGRSLSARNALAQIEYKQSASARAGEWSRPVRGGCSAK